MTFKCPACKVKVIAQAAHRHEMHGAWRDSPVVFSTCTACGHIVTREFGSMAVRSMSHAEREYLNKSPERVAMAKAAIDRVVRHLIG